MASTVQKTKAEWLDMLPEPYRSQARLEVTRLPVPFNDLNGIVNSRNQHDALMSILLFKDTLHGTRYWLNFCYKLHDMIMKFNRKPKESINNVTQNNKAVA